MKNVSVALEDAVGDFFAENSDLAAELLQREYRRRQKADKVKAVKVITRTKAPVLNWNDLEREILKGAAGVKN